MVDDLVSCLTWTKNGIYICFSLDGRPQYISFAKDENFNASTLTKILTVADTQGVPQCCNGRSVTTCNWSSDCAPLGACADGGGNGSGGTGPVPFTASTCAAPDAGGGGKVNEAGVSNEKPGCGCRLTTPESGHLGKAMLGVLVALMARRRRTVRDRSALGRSPVLGEGQP
jgi:hypothetical protein